ncbi:MAG: hypothetical protein RI945_49 [Candidatus Parcubacteria bacterium]
MLYYVYCSFNPIKMRNLLRKIYLLFKVNKSLDDFVWLYNHTKLKSFKKYFYKKAFSKYGEEAKGSCSKEVARENKLLFIRKIKSIVELSHNQIAADWWGIRERLLS